MKKLYPDDEGLLEAVAYIKNDQVVINFGKELRWVSLGRPELETLIKVLSEKLELLP